METFYIFRLPYINSASDCPASHANLHWNCRNNLWGTVSSLLWGFHIFSLGTLRFDRNIISWRNSLPFMNLMPLMTSTAHTIFRCSDKSTLYCSFFHCKLKKAVNFIVFPSLILWCPLSTCTHFCDHLPPWPSTFSLGCPHSAGWDSFLYRAVQRLTCVLLLDIAVMLVAFLLF